MMNKNSDFKYKNDRFIREHQDQRVLNARAHNDYINHLNDIQLNNIQQRNIGYPENELTQRRERQFNHEFNRLSTHVNRGHIPVDGIPRNRDAAWDRVRERHLNGENRISNSLQLAREINDDYDEQFGIDSNDIVNPNRRRELPR